MTRSASSLASPTSLPTPEQIAEFPELAPLHTLLHATQLAVRSIVAAHPDLDGAPAPYWAIEPSRTRRDALHLLTAASQLDRQIRHYLAALDRELDTDPTDTDSPF